MTRSSTMKLLNCRRCDDVQKLVEQERTCECGVTKGSISSKGQLSLSGPGRVFEIDWEAYDGIAEGEERAFGVLPRHRY
jgi:hypothetical protein